jgi:putative DNA primase/helicase
VSATLPTSCIGVMELDNEAFLRWWSDRKRSDFERSAIGEPGFARYRKLTPEVGKSSRSTAKRKNVNGADGLVVSGAAGAAVYSLTEDNLARAFTDQFGSCLRFSHDVGRWYVWSGSRWREDHTDLAFNWAREVCRRLNHEGLRQWAKAATATAVERFARSDRTFAMSGGEWNANPWLLATPSGTVELKTGTLRTAYPADLITRSTLVGPEEGEPRLWRQFLAEATQGDEELELFLRQIFGYALTGDTSEECLFYIYGDGRNGKGTAIGVLFDILGDYAAAATMDVFLASKFDRHSTDVAMLRGARLVIASETQKGRAWDEQRVKAFTGNDMITARFMRMDNFTFKPIFKMVLFGNSKPILRTVDAGWRRRFHIIPFSFKPPKQDATLKSRLRAEYGQILQWCIQGCLDWQQHGLVVPARVKAETAEYFSSQDQLQTWLDEHCEIGRDCVGTTNALFDSWQKFSERIGERPGTSRALAEELATHGFRRIKDTLGIRGRGFAGLRVKP